MGAWGVGIYDNDDAADWVAELEDGGLAVVSAALSTIVDGDYVEAPEGARAVAAADVVARLRSGGGEESPYCEGVVAWVRANAQSPTTTIVDLALRALERVRGHDSELRELWDENAESLPEWLAVVAEVERRLRS